jgi:RNA polymerase sigma-70 factor (ECF subfamily)
LKSNKDIEAEARQRFMELYEPVHERFVRFCKARAYGNYDADDLVNESVLAAYENFGKLRNDGAFLHFLFGIGTNLLRNHYRRRKFRGEYDEERADNLSSTTPNGEQSMDTAILYDALSELPDKQKEAIILFEISGFAIKEIMDIQESGESAVKARLVRGRKRLAEILREPARVSA